MCRRHQRLAECVQTSAGRGEDSCYGSARVSLWTESTATTSWCSALASPSRTLLETPVLLLAAHVTAVCRSGYNQLRQFRPVVRSLSVNATKTLVQAFISCRLDYCNSLLFGISDRLLRRLQSVPGAAIIGGRGDTSPQHFDLGDAKVNVPPTDCPFRKILGHIFHLDTLDYCISGVTGVSMHCFPHI